MLIEPLRTHIRQFFSSPSDLMMSTVVDESFLQLQLEFCAREESTYYFIILQI